MNKSDWGQPELYVAGYLLLVWGCQALGIDVGLLLNHFAGVSNALLEESVKASTDPNYVAQGGGIIYLVGKMLLRKFSNKE